MANKPVTWDMKDKKDEFKELYKKVDAVGTFEEFVLGRLHVPMFRVGYDVVLLFNFKEWHVQIAKKGGVPDWILDALKV